MSIKDLILPKWKHSHPEIRMKAVQDILPDNAEHIEILKQLAQSDSAPEVRMESIRKISDTDFLQDIDKNEPEASVKECIRNRLNSLYHDRILQASDNETRYGLIEKLQGEAILMTVASEIDDPDLRCRIVEKISDPELLCELARSNCGLKAGTAIVEKIHDPRHLEQIIREASNKKIRRKAEEKLGVVQAELHQPSPEEQHETELEQLCLRAERLLEKNGHEIGDLLDIRKISNELDPDGVHPLTSRLDQTLENIQEKIRQVQIRTQMADTLSEWCEGAERLAESMPEDVNLQIQELRAKWDALDTTLLNETDYQPVHDRFQIACTRIEQALQAIRMEKERYEQALQHIATITEQFENLSKTEPVSNWQELTDAWNRLEAEWNRMVLDTEDAKPFTQRKESAGCDLEARRKEHENFVREQTEIQKATLIAICERVEQTISAEDRVGLEKDVIASQKEWEQTGDLIPEIKAELSDRFQQACKTFFDKQAEFWELKEWERWANLNQKTELCEVVESLLNAPEPDGIGAIVREAQAKWKEIGPVAKDHSEIIWNRFKQTCDQVYDRVFQHKKQLYEEAASLAGLKDDSKPEGFSTPADCEERSEKIKQIQAKWNAIGFIPLAIEKELKEDFQNLCNDFFNRRRDFYQNMDEDRRNNLKQKIELCQQAQEVLNTNHTIKIAKKLKQLQKQWKEIGPTPAGEGEDVWQRFQNLCNGFFDRMEREKPENLIKKQALCEQAVALVSGDLDPEQVSRELIELQKEWKTIGPVPTEQTQEIWDRFHSVCDEFFERRRTELKTIEEKQSKHLQQKEALISEAESLSISTDWNETSEKLKAIQKQWKTIGTCSRKLEQDLWNRFRSACDKFFNRRKDFFENLHDQRSENLKKKENLCLNLEVLARMIMPDRVPSNFGEGSPAEQLSIAQSFKESVIVPGNDKATWANVTKKIKQIQSEWKDAGTTPYKVDQAIRDRYDKVLDIFFARRSG